MDKASIIDEAIKHIKGLQEKIKLIERQKTEAAVVVTEQDSQLSTEDGSSFSNENYYNNFLDIEIKFSDKSEILLRIHSRKNLYFTPKILREMEKLHLRPMNINIIPFGSNEQIITIIAQIKQGKFCMTLEEEELEKHLRAIVKNCYY